MTKLIFAFRNFGNAPKAWQGSCARFFKDLLKNYDNFDDPYISALVNRMSGRCVSKIIFILRTDFGWILIHKSSISNNVLHNLTFIKMTFFRFLGKGRFLIRYSEGHTK
jgi:hypothetical protein